MCRVDGVERACWRRVDVKAGVVGVGERRVWRRGARRRNSGEVWWWAIVRGVNGKGGGDKGKRKRN